MSATNGLARSLRTRSRLIGCCMAAVLALFALGAATAGATPVPVKETYLALGDSLAFGYSQQLFNENEKLGEPPSAFEHGYANYYLNHLRPKLNGVQLTNKGCPGETTMSMIGNNPVLLGGLNFALAGKTPYPVEGEAPCAYHAAGLPLHSEYGGKSQLESAMEAIAVDSFIGKPVTTVSLNIGANDELHSIGKCKAEVEFEWKTFGESKQYGGVTPEASVNNCIAAHVNELFGHILTNISGIYVALRNGASFGGANYLGKIIFDGGYDPYGNVFGTGELLAGSNGLQFILNQNEEAVGGKFGACFANTQTKFNPQNKTEPEKLQKWTNMANFSTFEGKANGPDIHPTPAGYKVISTVMVNACG
jgi:hypothetical protein